MRYVVRLGVGPVSDPRAVYGPFESREDAIAFAATEGYKPDAEDIGFRIHPLHSPPDVTGAGSTLTTSCGTWTGVPA